MRPAKGCGWRLCLGRRGGGPGGGGRVSGRGWRRWGGRCVCAGIPRRASRLLWGRGGVGRGGGGTMFVWWCWVVGRGGGSPYHRNGCGGRWAGDGACGWGAGVGGLGDGVGSEAA